MKYILSPAKTMRVKETHQYDTPYFEQEAYEIIEQLKQLEDDELQKMMKLSTKQVTEVKALYQNFGKIKTKAMDAYYGLVMKHAHLDQLDDDGLSYFQEHVHFLSAVYGLLKGNDGISSYRLEAKVKLKQQSIYEMWNTKIVNLLKEETIINLASKEYEPFLKPYIPSSRWIDIVFYVKKDNKLKVNATYAKMARGELIHYVCRTQVQNIDELKQFNALQFHYDAYLSDDNTLVFVREEI